MDERMIRLSGLEPGKDIEVVYTGLRPGEKIKEEVDDHFEFDSKSYLTDCHSDDIVLLNNK